MKVSRFFTTPDGNSTYDEVNIPIANHTVDAWGNQTSSSDAFSSPTVRIFEIADQSVQDWHNAPQRQLCVVLSGIWQVETTDGRSQSWGPGEMFLPDDVTGKGHISRVLKGPVRILFVPLEADFDISQWQQNHE